MPFIWELAFPVVPWQPNAKVKAFGQVREIPLPDLLLQILAVVQRPCPALFVAVFKQRHAKAPEPFAWILYPIGFRRFKHCEVVTQRLHPFDRLRKVAVLSQYRQQPDASLHDIRITRHTRIR